MAFLLPIGALVVLLVLDVRFPLLFWNLRHGLEVYGGEPTEWYYAMQRVSRITDIIGIFVLAAMSLLFTEAHSSSARMLFCTMSPAGVRARVWPSKLA